LGKIDFNTLSNEVIERIANGENMMAVLASAAERGVLLLEQETRVREAEIIEEGADPRTNAKDRHPSGPPGTPPGSEARHARILRSSNHEADLGSVLGSVRPDAAYLCCNSPVLWQ